MRILVRYGEIGVKSSSVRRKFEQRLMDNMERQLEARGIDGEVLEEDGRLFADVADDAAADAALALADTPGVVSVSPVVTAEVAMDAIAARAVEIVDADAETFAVEARRAGDHEFTSEDIQEVVGQRIVDETGLDVDLDDPDVTVSVEARYTAAYLHTETVEGVGGLPISTDDSVAVHLADRAGTVAAYRLMKRGCTVFPVYTGNHPDEAADEMATLRQFDPDVKLTVMAGEPAGEALDTVCDLYGCTAAAVPHTADELDELPETDAELLLPNCGRSTEDILAEYGGIMHVEL